MSLAVDRQLRFFRSEETDRPLLTFWVGSYYPLEQYRSLARTLPDGHLSPRDISIPALLQDYDYLEQMYARVEHDSTFVATPLAGFPWLEAMLGCPVSVSGGTFWAEPFVEDWITIESLPHPRGHGWLDKLQELTEALISHGDGRFPVSLPTLRGTSDLIASARGHSRFPLDLYDHPGEIKQLASICLDLWMSATTHLSALIPPFRGGHCSPAYGLWAPGEVVLLQQDTSALMSPRFYQEMILPGDAQISERFEFSVFHLHPTSAHILEDILALSQLAAVELNYELGGPDLDVMIPIWRHMQNQKPLVIWGEFKEHELSRVLAALDPRGLALHLVVSDRENAAKMTGLVERTVFR